MSSLKGYYYITGATLFWGVSATIARFLFTQHVDAVVLVQTRTLISCVVLLIVLVLFKRDLLIIRRHDLYKFVLLGVIGVAGSNFTYYYAIEQTNVATAILLQYLSPLLVLGYAAISGDERLTVTKLLAALVSLAGCFLAVAGNDLSVLHANGNGLLSGLSAAGCWGFANIWMRRVVKDYPTWTVLVYAFFFASVFWMFVQPPWILVAANYPSTQWGTFFLFAFSSALIPHALYFAGVRHLTASRAIITATFEPIVAIGSAYLLLGELLTGVQIAGALLVLLAIVVLQRTQDPAPELQP